MRQVRAVIFISTELPKQQHNVRNVVPGKVLGNVLDNAPAMS
jgi:hypothetical protein